MVKYFALLIPIWLLFSCQDENKYRWTDVDINLTEVGTNQLPDSIHFWVQGRKNGIDTWGGSIVDGEGTVEIDDYIVNGNYSGGFLSKSKSRWRYNILIRDNFLDSFYIVAPFDRHYFPWDIEKRKQNNCHLNVSKKQPVTIISHLSGCNEFADRIRILIKHKEFEPYFDLAPKSDDWYSGSHTLQFLGCDTVVRNYYYPPGSYEVGVKTLINGSETDYGVLEFEVFEDSINTLELYF